MRQARATMPEMNKNKNIYTHIYIYTRKTLTALIKNPPAKIPIEIEFKLRVMGSHSMGFREQIRTAKRLKEKVKNKIPEVAVRQISRPPIVHN